MKIISPNKHSILSLSSSYISDGTSLLLLIELKAGRCAKEVEVRLLLFWEARNVKKGGELMGLTFYSSMRR